MTEVVVPEHHGRHGSNIFPMVAPGGPRIDMVPNSDFSFPIRPRVPESRRQQDTTDPSRRPASASMHIDIPPSDFAKTHRRAVSTLPSFNFNATDTSGLTETVTPPQTPEETTAVTPSRRGHRRGGSEFVGGDSRLGVSNALSSSPAKSNVLPHSEAPAPEPAQGRRGHSHRRSAAISSHDVSKLMQLPTEVQPRLSSSLPTTPLEYPSDPIASEDVRPSNSANDESDPFGPPLEDPIIRPPSRPRVGFSENVEYIPRPLSTISSETESSISTIRGHSLNNSISSMLSLGTPSPPSYRMPNILIKAPLDDQEPAERSKSSVEISRRVEKEGQWLRRRSSGSPKRPASESAMSHPRTTFALPESPVRRRKHSFSHALGFDRRRSEPSIGSMSDGPCRLSAISLQDTISSAYESPDASNSQVCEHKSSARRIKDWAASKISRKSREASKALIASSSTSSIRPESAGSVSVPGRVPIATAPVAETDLDAVFGSQCSAQNTQGPDASLQPRIDVHIPATTYSSDMPSRDYDESEAMLDLDAALGPFKTPPIGSHRQRKELHSSRGTKDFNGPGGHYHRRTESAPNLSPFENCEKSLQPGMADVFEEDEEDDANAARPTNIRASSDGVVSTGRDIHLTALRQDSAFERGLGIREDSEPGQLILPYGTPRSLLAHVGSDGRASPLIEDTIAEEGGLRDSIEIVEAHEEPRTSSLTKSSDSSDTPTVLASTDSGFLLPEIAQSLKTPDTYQNSAFSTPALGRASLDTNRLDTAASSFTDNRTVSSFATGEHGQDLRPSVDVPSLTSSRSTMISTMAGNNSRRDFGSADRTSSTGSQPRDPPTPSEQQRRKRGSIQSLSQLVSGSFSGKSKGLNDSRPQSAADVHPTTGPKKKEHRLKKLMFWKSKQHSSQSLRVRS